MHACNLIYALLREIGFSELALTGKSGDGGIDLTGTWTPPHDFAPGLEINLDFVIQAKRTDPKKPLNPIYLRALKGSMTAGQWGLLVTTGRISSRTREEGLKDPARIVSTISGSDLAELCARHQIGVRQEYEFDKSFLKPEPELAEPEPAPVKTIPRDIGKILADALGETFTRVGRSQLYRSESKILIARWSQRYQRKGQNYWYALTSSDVESVKNYDLTHFAYVCSDVGVILLPASVVMERVRSKALGRTPKAGPLRHYHIQFEQVEEKIFWILRNGVKENVTPYFHKLSKAPLQNL